GNLPVEPGAAIVFRSPAHYIALHHRCPDGVGRAATISGTSDNDLAGTHRTVTFHRGRGSETAPLAARRPAFNPHDSSDALPPLGRDAAHPSVSRSIR